ncbi:uncharacterized protein Bfra_007745 [Botrytis fragariae]|uniref:Uncharacterized protein n=1 Tax=Botrytis fragariae TaxID=1964551 RepID=A0A8H6EGB2_9HELO|nr:uncharacterized protein Bfra_007745 [Botrytis fragariae]KAF5871232.1 hypothetical protein Bfra_007745 [Botrytis fragariae]
MVSFIYAAHLRTIVLTETQNRPVSHSYAASRYPSVVNESIESSTLPQLPRTSVQARRSHKDIWDAQNKASENYLTAYAKNDFGDVSNPVHHLSESILEDFAAWSEASHNAFDHVKAFQESHWHDLKP